MTSLYLPVGQETPAWPPVRNTELRRMVPYTHQHILRLEKQGSFPRRIRLGANRVVWLESDVLGWLDQRIAERDRDVAFRG